jgi:hypothetical protein
MLACRFFVGEMVDEEQHDEEIGPRTRRLDFLAKRNFPPTSDENLGGATCAPDLSEYLSP